MSLYNDDELEAPEWVNEEFLIKVLKNSEKIENVKIVSYDVTPASLKGDHFGSVMLRCKIKYSRENDPKDLEKSLIIKTLPSAEGTKRDMLMGSCVFDTEIKMYTEALPYMEKILADNGEITRLAAKIYYHSLHPHKVVVFEDLCESGYDLVRDRFLTEDEAKVVFTKLAQLHAASYFLGQSDQHQLVTQYQRGTFTASLPMMENMVTSGVKNFINLLAEHEDLHIYMDKVKAMEGTIFKACEELYGAYNLSKGKNDEIFVLNHGDCHIKNLMFKFDANNKIVDMIMVDYQLSCFAPSIIDTTYSQYMILSPALRRKRHEFMQYYFSEFIRILKKINCPGELPKLEKLNESAVRHKEFTMFLVAVFLPMMMSLLSKSLDDLKEMDTTKFMENPNMIADTYHMPQYIQELRILLPTLLKEGYFDN